MRLMLRLSNGHMRCGPLFYYYCTASDPFITYSKHHVVALKDHFKINEVGGIHLNLKSLTIGCTGLAQPLTKIRWGRKLNV